MRSLQLRPVPPLSHIDLFLEEGIAFRNIGIILQKFANVNTFFEIHFYFLLFIFREPFFIVKPASFAYYVKEEPCSEMF